jgi:hypothetical protein
MDGALKSIRGVQSRSMSPLSQMHTYHRLQNFCGKSSQQYRTRHMPNLVRLKKEANPVAQVCDGSRQGDWIVFYEYKHIQRSMILRENSNGRYGIVGYALTGSFCEDAFSNLCGYYMSERRKTFDLCIDLEDFLRIAMWNEGLLNEVSDVSKPRLPITSLQAHLSASLTLSGNSYGEKPNCWDPFHELQYCRY